MKTDHALPVLLAVLTASPVVTWAQQLRSWPEPGLAVVGQDDLVEGVRTGLTAVPGCTRSFGVYARAWIGRPVRAGQGGGLEIQLEEGWVSFQRAAEQVGAAYSAQAITVDAANAAMEGAGDWACQDWRNVIIAGRRRPSVPAQWMAAVALTESGIGDRPWPWSINWRGGTYRFRTKSAAVQAANSLIERGDANFDVGAFQINWRYHMARFGSISSAFDVLTNLRAAEDILAEHYVRTASWPQAVADYHNRDPKVGAAYLNRVVDKLKVATR